MASFEEDIADLTRALRAQASQDIQRSVELSRIQAQEQAARFGLGGVTASGLTGVEREGSEQLVSALRQADIFGARELAGERSRETAFGREAGLRRELQANELAFAREQVSARAAEARSARRSAITTGIVGGLANIGGTLIGQRFSPLNRIGVESGRRNDLLQQRLRSGTTSTQEDLSQFIRPFGTVG